MHLGPPVLDKVERSWSCWRHPNASGVGLKVAGAMETVEPHKAQSDFLEGVCGRVQSVSFQYLCFLLFCPLGVEGLCPRPIPVGFRSPTAKPEPDSN